MGIRESTFVSVLLHFTATAATCALENQADIAKVQEWLGHANINPRAFTTGAKPVRPILRPLKSRIEGHCIRAHRKGSMLGGK
jgi:hypothetical protein